MDRAPHYELNTVQSYETMTFEEYGKTQHNPVYVFEIENNGKKITYFGSEHSHAPRNPMFRDIEKKFWESDPEIVFVEGMHFSKNGKGQLKEEMKKADFETVIKEWGESGFTFKLAVDAGKEVDSPKPDFKEEVSHLLSFGFAKEELFAYYAYQQANSYQRMPEKPPLEAYLNSYIKHFQKDTDWKDFDYSLGHLERIGKEIWGDRADISVQDETKTNPVPAEVPKEDWTRINELCQQSSYFRDRSVIQKIGEALQTYNRLFIVFGSTHAVMQERALRSLFEKN